MQLNWKIKSLAFRVLNALGLHRFLYFLQKNVTKRGRQKFDAVRPNWILHQEAIGAGEAIRLIEFGAGQSLVQNLYLAFQFEGRLQQLVVDLFPMVDVELVEDARAQLAALLGRGGERIDDLAALKQHYGIEYNAPFDLANHGGSIGGFDVCISTDTLEHIPEADIIRIFNALKGILKEGGRISAVIDYSDHYSHTDRTIGPLNFLQYSDAEWRRHNTAMHYQNRMRHQDYRGIFSKLGFQIVGDRILGSAPPPATVNERFDANNQETLATSGHFILVNE